MTKEQKIANTIDDYLVEEQLSFKSVLGVIAHLLAIQALYSPKITSEDISLFNKDRFQYIEKYNKNHGKDIYYACLCQAMIILSWFNEDNNG